jgi:hypothetical protein
MGHTPHHFVQANLFIFGCKVLQRPRPGRAEVRSERPATGDLSMPAACVYQGDALQGSGLSIVATAGIIIGTPNQAQLGSN